MSDILHLLKTLNKLVFVSVSALREHWAEANARVLQRKAQLDAMLGDSQRYEARRRDADAWLTRMEARLAAMAPPGHTADVLDTQLRDQKVHTHRPHCPHCPHCPHSNNNFENIEWTQTELFVPFPSLY